MIAKEGSTATTVTTAATEFGVSMAVPALAALRGQVAHSSTSAASLVLRSS